MDFFENRYHRLSRFFLLLIGQWPYDHSKVKLISRTLACVVMASGVDVQVSKLITCGHDFAMFLETFPPFVICILCCVKYFIFWINQNLVKDLLEHVKYDWNALTASEEMKIMEEYAEYGKLFATAYLLLDYCGLLGCMFVLMLPCILDVLFPLDEPRHRIFLFQAEYFIDQQKYFYPIIIHMFIIVTVAFGIAGGPDIMNISFVLHACGTFSVLGHRLEHIFDDAIESAEDTKKKNGMCKFSARIRNCVKYQCRILEYLRIFNSCNGLSYAIQFLLCILMLTGLLVKVFDAITVTKNINDALISSVHVLGIYFIIFLNILPMQMLLDYSEEIFHKMYFARWYMVSVRLQKSVLAIMQNSMKAYGLTACTITASLQIFATMIQTTMSYFTVLYSMRG